LSGAEEHLYLGQVSREFDMVMRFEMAIFQTSLRLIRTVFDIL